MLRTYVYVDGFNLYYRALKETAFKWLDLRALMRAVLKPENQIDRIRYFTADVSANIDPGAPARQRAYLNALATLPEVTIHKGNFLVSKRMALLVQPPRRFQQVYRVDEKGSDVNLASHLLLDGFRNRYDVAAVVTNDTDLVEPIRMVIDELHKTVGIVSPAPKPAGSLTQVAQFVRRIDAARLKAAQFPDPIPGTTIRKPASW